MISRNPQTLVQNRWVRMDPLLKSRVSVWVFVSEGKLDHEKDELLFKEKSETYRDLKVKSVTITNSIILPSGNST